MKIDAGEAASLRAIIREDVAAVRRMSSALRALDAAASETDWIAVGYYLHGIYNALENSFDQISRTYENHVKDTTRWHEELLRKMFLDLSPIRPAVLPESVRHAMNDLRGFRHVFRHTYGGALDVVRLRSVADRWQGAEREVVSSVEGFAAGLVAPG